MTTKILFLHSVSTGSGANTHVDEFTRSAAAHGAEIRCMAQATQSIQTGGRRIRLPIPQLCKDVVYLSNNRTYRQKALAVAAEFRPDVVYFRGAPYMSYGRGVADTLGVPLYYELNAPYPDEHVEYHGGTLEGVARRIEHRNRAAAERIFVVSEELARIVSADGTPRERIVVVPNAVRLEAFDPTPRPDDGTIRFGFVGSLQVWHGIEVLLESFDRILDEDSRAVLEIVGRGPLDAWLADRIDRSTHGDRITWHGPVPPGEIPEFLSRMDVLLAPYPPKDRFYFSPLKLFEYLAAGRTIVASNIGQIGDVLTDGIDGRLVPPGDVGALASTCLDVAGDADARAALGRAARETAERHTWDANASTILSHIRPTANEAVS